MFGRFCHHTTKLNKISRKSFTNHAPFVKVSQEVKAALSENSPVVALESTIITHGLPYPQNINTALSVEDIIRKNGAIPATIGIKEGELLIGMNENEIHSLADVKSNVIKTSRRDLSYVISNKLDGGTTVCGTMLAANMVGIDVFVTGGIGGVHRGAPDTFDISADLMELSRTPVAVICAGVKSILDIGLTLEYLETQGVPVITYGPTKDFPAFFTPKSKFKAPYNTESAEEIAKLIHNQLLMDMKNGVIIGVPIPSNNENLENKIEKVIDNALEEAKTLGIIGKDITPFVLAKVVELTGGDSLLSNVKLIENNAKIGAQISVELSKLKCKGRTRKSSKMVYNSNFFVESTKLTKKRPVVIGGSIFDIKATVDSISEIQEETNLGRLHTSFGGVGRNIAECLGRLGTDPLLISSVGKDHQGEMMLNNMEKLGMDTSGIYISDMPTASYSAVANHTGELMLAIGDMENHDGITPDTVFRYKDDIINSGMVILDGNICRDTIMAVLKLCSEHNVSTWFDPATVGKGVRPFVDGSDVNISYISPNIEEMRAIHRVLHPKNNGTQSGTDMELKHLIEECVHKSPQLLHHVDNLVITLGHHGILLVSKRPSNMIFSSKQNIQDTHMSVLHYPPANKKYLPVSVKSVSGAGDSFASGVIYGYLHGYDTDTCVKGGLLAAYKSLQTYVAISHEMTEDLLSYKNIHNWADFEAESIEPTR